MVNNNQNHSRSKLYYLEGIQSSNTKSGKIKGNSKIWIKLCKCLLISNEKANAWMRK